MRRICFFLMSLLMVQVAVSCSGQSGEQKSDQDEVREMEIIPKVKEPQTEVVDTVGFPEEATGTPIRGYQGYPEDDLVKESKDEELVDFAGGTDVDYYNGGGSSDGY